MRALLLLLSAVFILASCSKEVQLVATANSQDPVTVEEKGMVELRLSQTDLAKYVDVEDGIWEEARRAGLSKVFTKMVTKDIVLVPVDGVAPLGVSDGAYSQSGIVSRDVDDETGDLVQSFMISTRFVGDLDLGGQIVTLEEGRFIAGMHDVTYAMLYKTVPTSLPAYVVIVQPLDELGSSFYRVTGLAEVKQILQNDVILPDEQGGGRGTLCALEVVASDREIEPENKLFLLSVDVAALDSQDLTQSAGELETVVVQPPQTDTVQEPKEKK